MLGMGGASGTSYPGAQTMQKLDLTSLVKYYVDGQARGGLRRENGGLSPPRCTAGETLSGEGCGVLGNCAGGGQDVGAESDTGGRTVLAHKDSAGIASVVPCYLQRDGNKESDVSPCRRAAGVAAGAVGGGGSEVARARALQSRSVGARAYCGAACNAAARKSSSFESPSVEVLEEEDWPLGDMGHPVALTCRGRRGGWGACAVAVLVLAYLHRNKPWVMCMLARGLNMLRKWVGKAALPTEWLAAGGGARSADRWVGRLEMAAWVLAFRLLCMCRAWCSSSVVRELRQSK